MDELNVRPNEKTPIMATDTNTFQFRPSHTRIRWIVVGFVFTALEVVASAVGDEMLPGPKWLRASIVGLILACAFVARFMAAREDD